MLVAPTTSLVLSTLVFAASTIAAPTRTHCRCTIASDAPSHAIYTPSSAHGTTSEPSLDLSTSDICFNLGPELENIQHTKPDVYDFYVGHVSPSTGDEQRPMATTILLNYAARNGFQEPQRENEPRPTSRPRQRIVCHSEVEPFSTYQNSFGNLWALQIIIAVSILACVAEGVHIGMRWMNRRNEDRSAKISQKSSLRLPGAEKRLLAIPSPNTETYAVFSPGAKKKQRAYESTRYYVAQSSSGRREFIAYEDDDDEINRPVM